MVTEKYVNSSDNFTRFSCKQAVLLRDCIVRWAVPDAAAVTGYHLPIVGSALPRWIE